MFSFQASRFIRFFQVAVICVALCACGKKQADDPQASASSEAVAASVAASTTVNAPPVKPAIAETADSFIGDLQAKMKTYDEAALRKLIDEFNVRQLKSYGIERAGEDLPPLPQGVVQIEFEDLGEHVSLQLREVLTAHSNDIDTGVDQFRSVFFAKSDMKKLADIDSKSQALPDTSMRIAVGKQQSCMGDAPGDGYTIFDLKQNGKAYLAEKFQDQAQSFEVKPVKPVKPGTIQLLTRSESDFKGKEKDAQQCEIGSWVDVLETTYTISCDAKAGKCTTQKKQKTFPACSAVGACD